MRAKLIHIEPERARAIAALARDEQIIGRDPACHVVIDDTRVSRQHARIWCEGQRHWIADLGSANGTSINGQRLATAQELAPDDRIELGNAVVLRYERQSSNAWLRLGVAACSAAALSLAIGLWNLRQPDSDALMDEAEALAQLAVDAFGRGDWEATRAKLNAAVGLLYDAGRLDDVPRLQRPDVGLRRIGQALPGAPDLEQVYRRASEQERAQQLERVEVAAPCRLDSVEPADVDLCIRTRAEEVLAAVWQHPGEVPESFYAAVHAQMRLLVEQRRPWLEQSLARGQALREMMEAELTAENMPPILRYLALIESGYENRAVSRAQAVGIWQFVEPTARAYDLVVTEQRDDRRDARKATRAAARYLNALAFEFGGDALLLAIASYNKGENGVRSALKKLRDPRTDRTYWKLVERNLLPAETRDYVPRFVAAAILGEAGLPPVRSVAR